ncbi:MAG: hypothetical protein CFE22_10150 [Cytophagaceae bacterium BCCC1]|nr:MAG: hypothetical protein CFE22_10150 [Cytophagaceae bacterium BCCC1]
MSRILTILLSICLTVSSFANDPFQKENFSVEFKKLNQLEAIVNANPSVTIDSVIKEQPQLLKDLGINNEAKSSIGGEDPMRPAGFPAFWWGFCLGIWGILIVYLITDNDKAALNKTVKGCITAMIVYGGITAFSYLIIFITALSSTAY